jgi:hypothetical protein
MPWKFNVTAQSSQREKDYFFAEIATRLKFDVFTWNPPSVAASTTTATVIDAATYPEVTGCRVGMAIKVTPPATFPAGMVLESFVDADDTITVVLTNFTAGPIDIGETDWPFMGVIIS